MIYILAGFLNSYVTSEKGAFDNQFLNMASPTPSNAAPNGTSSLAEMDKTPPNGFRTLRSIIDAALKELKSNSLVNVIGLVKDCRPPIPTRKTDWKMGLELIDFSIEDVWEHKVMRVEIFKKKDKMFEMPQVGQPVLITAIKVQVWQGAVSLLTTYATRFSFFPAAIPRWPLKSRSELPVPTGDGRPVEADQAAYVVLLQNFCSRDRLPTEVDYDTSLTVAMNSREKFSELCNIQDHKFYDLIVEVAYVHRVGGSSDMVTVYVTDYTTNEQFYLVARPGGAVQEGTEDDPYGYLAGKMPKPMKTEDGQPWRGPYGKMTLQITAFDKQAEYFLENVKPNDWVKLYNVQIKFTSGGHLEGKLRHDRQFPDKILIEPLLMPGDPESMDLRWKSAIRRKRNYQNRQKREEAEREEGLNEAAGVKRKAEEEEPPQKMNAKKRRQEERKARKLKEQEAQNGKSGSETHSTSTETPAPAVQPVKKMEEDTIPTNKLVRFNKKWTSTPRSTIPQILSNRPSITLPNGTTIIAPFTNTKYRTIVRVVDYFPHNLEDFSKGKRASEFDCLSDAESGSDTEVAAPKGPLDVHVADYSGNWKWKWNFMIQVEDATPTNNTNTPKPRIWLSIDNDRGQHLLNTDADNLHLDKSLQATIREKLFILWGDLEERKSAYLRSGEGKVLLAMTQAPHELTPSPSPPPTVPSTLASSPLPMRKGGGEMPPDSEDEDKVERTRLQTQRPSLKDAEKEKDKYSPHEIRQMKPAEAKKLLVQRFRSIGEKAQNKPFEACVWEWGVKVSGEGEEPEYKRAWGLVDCFINH